MEKSMTREEQIKQQAMRVLGVPPELNLLGCFILGFKEGAKWADENPIRRKHSRGVSFLIRY